ncbi:MAG: alpha-xylosidase [Spirochaetales bacterium]|nr:alpha-xylosidase [Spirochaetales bacterium]
MKFTEGFWRNQPGMQVFNAVRVYDYELGDKTITAYAPHFDVQNRGQTLWGPLITVRLSSPMEDVIRVQAWHYQGQTDRGPGFQLNEAEKCGVKISECENQLSLKSGNLEARLSIDKNWDMSFFNGQKELTNSRWRNLGYVLDGNKAFMKEQLALDVNDKVYGFGEKFTPFVKNGQVVDVWNADGGTASELAYKCVPFYYCSKGYGVFVNDPGAVSFEVASEVVARVQFSVPGEYLEYFVINGPDAKSVLKRYTALTGRPALPPAWSFGLWLTTSFITQYDEKTVTAFIEGMKKRDLPLHVFHFDCFWMKDYSWTNFEWDKKQFPDPQGFLSRLKKRGLKICVWINPYIAQRSGLFQEGMEKGYLLKKLNGDVWQCDDWQPGMGMVDFTNPEACEWYAGYLDNLIDMGVDTFKTDFGERIPVENVAWYDGSDPVKMHNYYSFLYNKVVFETLEKKQGKAKALVFARSGTVGSQRFPVHWGGDCAASYTSMAESLRGGLSLCASGFGFWSHDISGFEMTASPDIYKRWTAFGLLSSHSRLHGNASYRVPWLFDEEAVDVLRFFTKLKCGLMPYIYAAAVEASESGVPTIRAMFMEFPDDPACEYLDLQYCFGPNLLVAPVFREDGLSQYYLPYGRWTHLLSNNVVLGGRWFKETFDYFSLPLFVRENSIIPRGKEDSRPDYDFAQDVLLQVYEVGEGKSAFAEVFDSSGSSCLIIEARRTGNSLEISVSGDAKPWSLQLINRTKAESVEMERQSNDRGVILRPNKYSGDFLITL